MGDAHDADDEDEEEEQGMNKQDALEHEYDTRLENEKKQIEEYYEGKQTELNAQLHDVKDNNTKLQQQCASMQSQCNSMQNEIDSLKQKESKCVLQIENITLSKFQLIHATSSEIDALRRKIKMFTTGDWNGL